MISLWATRFSTFTKGAFNFRHNKPVLKSFKRTVWMTSRPTAGEVWLMIEVAACVLLSRAAGGDPKEFATRTPD